MIFFGWLVFYVMLFFGCYKVWGWFQFLGGRGFFGWVSVGFCSVSVPLNAVGCCFYIGALVGLVVWFLWRFCNFAEFCQFVPFQFCEFLYFLLAGMLFGSKRQRLLFLFF